MACHNAAKRQVRPAFKEVAKRNYTNKEIVELIHQSKPANWPGSQVLRDEAMAAWINYLNE